MAGMVREKAATVEERFGLNSLLPPRPGVELAERIEAACQGGRPGIRIGARPDDESAALWVPIARALGFPRGGGITLLPKRQGLQAVLPRRLAIFLETGHPVAYDELGPHDRAAGNRLYAAALSDLLAMRQEEVAAVCGFADARTARDAIKRGRSAWHKVSAWPWLCFEDGKPPTEWRSAGGDRRVVGAFGTWATGWFWLPRDQSAP